MSRRLRILMVSAEAFPYVRGGGLADTVSALAHALGERGHHVDLLLPHVPALQAQDLGPLTPVCNLELPVGGRDVHAQLLSPLTDGPVRPLLLSIPEYFDRPYLYGPEPEKDAADNCSRFAALARAAILCHAPLRQRHDVMHAFDWPTGLAPYFSREIHAAGGSAGARATVFTAHNLAYQGNFWAFDLPILGLGKEHFDADRLEFFGRLSFLKAGLVSADRLTTVSTSYAREIQSAEAGMKLDGLLRARAHVLTGILAGLDLARWNPATDTALANRYTDPNGEARRRNVQALRAALQLPDNDAPLMGFVGALSPEKGGDALLAAAPEMVGLGVKLALYLQGHDAQLPRARALMEKHPEHVAVVTDADENRVRALLGGCDFFLVPSRVEPCSTLQLAAMRYGAVPLVRRTGSLRDTVLDTEASATGANGVAYIGDGPAPLLGAVKRALALYQHPVRYQAVQKHASLADVGSAASAIRYEALYFDAMGAAAPAPA